MKQSKLLLTLAAGVALACFTNRVMAADDADKAKETTITGTMVCGKCSLHETKSCQNVVQVQENGKTVNYYLKQNDVSKKQHEAICGGSSEKVTVTGTVKEKDGKEMMTPTKIETVKS